MRFLETPHIEMRPCEHIQVGTENFVSSIRILFSRCDPIFKTLVASYASTGTDTVNSAGADHSSSELFFLGFKALSNRLWFPRQGRLCSCYSEVTDVESSLHVFPFFFFFWIRAILQCNILWQHTDFLSPLRLHLQ